MEPIHLNVACGSKILSVSNEYPADNSSMAKSLDTPDIIRLYKEV